MKKHRMFVIQILSFLVIISILVCVVNNILTPKKYYENMWSTTSTYEGFYKMEKNTVDVLFLGSSHAASTFIPQVMYDEYGIRSYNLGCEQQNLLVSYYWLKEALRYQQPQVVVLDSYVLYDLVADENLNSSESCTRMAIDAMRWSPLKLEAVRAICKNDEKQSFKSYLLTNIRYHSRWIGLTQNDFIRKEQKNHYELKGYAPMNSKSGREFEPFCSNEADECDNMHPLMMEYLNKITEICREKGIKLILTKTPTAMWNSEKYKATLEYAENNTLEFWDYNEESLYSEADFVFSEDMSDNDHSNIWGAEKITASLAKKLSNDIGVKASKDLQWDNSKAFYSQVRTDCELKYITDICQYLETINSEYYAIFISSLGDTNAYISEDIAEKLYELGLSSCLEANKSYCAVKSHNNISEKVEEEEAVLLGNINGGQEEYSLRSSNIPTDLGSSIRINGSNYSCNAYGINIVVYSVDRRKVVDSCYYDGELHRS